MNMLAKLKKNYSLRGLYFLYKEYLGIRTRSFGYIADNVTITPPLLIEKPNNVFLGPNIGLGLMRTSLQSMQSSSARGIVR